VWLGSVLDCVVARVQPERPEELNRRDLVTMHCCDLAPAFPAHLVTMKSTPQHARDLALP
jgi:hypothetical protein